MPPADLKASPEPEIRVRARKVRRLAVLLETASESMKLYEDECDSMQVEVPAGLREAHELIREYARQTRDNAALMERIALAPAPEPNGKHSSKKGRRKRS